MTDKERIAKDLVNNALSKFLGGIELGFQLADAAEVREEYRVLLHANLIDLAASCLAETTSMPADVAEALFARVFKHYREKLRRAANQR